MNITYEPKEIIVEIEGNEYVVAPRTEALEAKLREHDDNLDKNTQYENDISMVQLLLGKEAVKKLFPNGTKEDLDRLYVYANAVKSAYFANYNQLKEEIEEKDLEPVMDKLAKLSAQLKPIAEVGKLQNGKVLRNAK